MSNNNQTDVERHAELFKALSNPTRLKIYLRLVNCCAPGSRWSSDEADRLVVGQLGKNLGVAPSTVSHHIKELVQAGLIRTERKGQTVECWVDTETVNGLVEFLSGPLEG